VHNIEGDTTFCPKCHSKLIERDWYEINEYRLTKDGHCPDCGTAIAGKFAKEAGHFGRNRIPIAINMSKHL
jgi:pyruvate formate lyase activating enzyme